MRMDIDSYTKRAGRVELDGIDFDDFRSQPLDDATLRCLGYMHDVEHHTVCYLRDLLVTSAHRDAAVTSFLTMWCFEEYWHGDAIGRVLAAHDEPSGPARIASVRGALRWNDRLAPTLHSLGSWLAGASYGAVHMTWGAVNEWTTHAGYARLAARSGHPTLAELLRRIMRQEGRHIDFYASQAASRLSDDRRAQRLTRFALRKLWKPVGSDVMPPGEVRFMVHHLFGDDSGMDAAERIDRNVDRLPGLGGLHLIRGAAARYDAAA
jgi:hypothetical protein